MSVPDLAGTSARRLVRKRARPNCARSSRPATSAMSGAQRKRRFLHAVRRRQCGRRHSWSVTTGDAYMTNMISAAFPYQKQRRRVLGREMAYLEVGQGDPILLLHGNPASSYLWRNVLPHLQPLGRCIAPDLIGMGDSDKLPNSGPGSYRFIEHRRYLDALLEALDVRERVI